MGLLEQLTGDQLTALIEEVGLQRLDRALTRYGLEQLLRLRLVDTTTIGQPAAGTDWSTVVPGGHTWEVLSVRSTLVTSAAAGARVPVLGMKDSDASYAVRFAPGGSANSSITEPFCWFIGGPPQASLVAEFNSQLPSEPWIVPAGYTLSVATNNLQVGDQWSAVKIVARRWSADRLVSAAQQAIADLESAGGLRYSLDAYA